MPANEGLNLMSYHILVSSSRELINHFLRFLFSFQDL